jgi:hypothetical protein
MRQRVKEIDNAHLFRDTVTNRFQQHDQSLELGDKHLHALTRTILIGGELLDG